MSARDELRDCFLSDSRSRFDSAADAYRAEVLTEQAAEMAALQARVAELEAECNAHRTAYGCTCIEAPELDAGKLLHSSYCATTFQDPCRPCGCLKRFDRHAWGCPTLPADDVPHVGPAINVPQQRSEAS